MERREGKKGGEGRGEEGRKTKIWPGVVAHT
jgi:hypothetical protein